MRLASRKKRGPACNFSLVPLEISRAEYWIIIQMLVWRPILCQVCLKYHYRKCHNYFLCKKGLAMSNLVTAYVLDNRDRIIWVIGDWDIFASENEGTELFSKNVCWRSIWDFVTDDVSRMWLESLFQLARLRGTSIERSYRCDSPDLKRFMRMSIVTEQCEFLRIEHEVLSTEQRSAPLHINYSTINMKNTKQRCSICGRLNIGGWQEPHANHAGASTGITVIYTVCEDCQLLMPCTL